MRSPRPRPNCRPNRHSIPRRICGWRFNSRAPTICPTFFPYEMHNFGGVIRYQGGRVEMVKLSARHGVTDLKLDAGEVRFGESGELWANLGGISMAPLATDGAFLKALPEKLRKGLQELKLRGPAELQVKHLVIRQPPDPARRSEVVATRPAARGQMPSDDTLVTVPAAPDRWREHSPARSELPSAAAAARSELPSAAAAARSELPSAAAAARSELPSAAAAAPELQQAGLAVPAGQEPSIDAQPAAASLPLAPRWPLAAETPAAERPAPVAPLTLPADPPTVPSRKEPAGLLPFTLPWQKSKPSPATPAPPSPPRPPEPSTIMYWNVALKLQGASLELGLPLSDVYGVLASTGRYEGSHLGSVAGHAWIDKAMLSRQPLTSAKLSYRIRAQQPDPQNPGTFLPPAVEVYDIAGSYFQGTVNGEARVVLADPARYRVWLTATNVKLEDLAKHYKLANGAELSGLAQGQFLFENTLDTKSGKLIPTGSGQIDVPKGRMYNLPVLLDLVKVLKGQVPDGCAFEEAHATFELKGDRIKVTQLDLLGSAVSLGGEGELDTEGNHVKFEFYTIWSQTLKRWLSTPLGDVTGLLSGSLFKMELTRENGKLTPRAHMLPVITDPVRGVAERLRNRPDAPPTRPRTRPQRFGP